MGASEKLKALSEPYWSDWNVDQFLATYTPLVAVVEAAEAAMERGQQMPVQLSDERGASMGFSTYAAFEMPLAEALAAALAALDEVL